MARETRHLWVGNLPENIREERIKEHFKRFGRVQSVKILGSKRIATSKTHSTLSVPSNNNNNHNNNNGDLTNGHAECSETATVAFMDITSACKALSVEHSLDDRKLHTDFYDPTRTNNNITTNNNNDNNSNGGTLGVPNSPSVSVGSNHSTAASGSRGSSPDVLASRVATNAGLDSYENAARSSSSHHTLFRGASSATVTDAAAPNFVNASAAASNANRAVGNRLSSKMAVRGAFLANGTASDRPYRSSWHESGTLAAPNRVMSTEKGLCGSSSPLFSSSKTSVEALTGGNSSPAHSTASSTGSAGQRVKSRSHRDHSHRRGPSSHHSHRSHNHHTSHHHHRTTSASTSSSRRSGGSNRVGSHKHKGDRSRRSEEEQRRINGYSKLSRLGDDDVSSSTVPMATTTTTTTTTTTSSMVDESPSSSADERPVNGSKDIRRCVSKFGSKPAPVEETSSTLLTTATTTSSRRSCSTSSSSSRASSTSNLSSSSDEETNERRTSNRPRHHRHRHRDRHRRGHRGLEHLDFHSSRGSKSGASRHQNHGNASDAAGRRRESPATTATRSNCAILVRHLNARTSDLCLKDSLISEYKKLSLSVLSVRLVRPSTCSFEDMNKPVSGRYAIVYFATKMDALKAVEETERVAACCGNSGLSSSPILGNASSGAWASGLEVEPFLLDDTLVEHKRLFHRPSDAEMDEFHPTASRTLHVGSLMLGGPKSLESSSTTVELLKEKLAECGEILEVDLKRSQGYAWVQFKDVRSVCSAIKKFNATNASFFAPVGSGPSTGSEMTRLKLGFARPVLTKCVWCRGFGSEVTKECLVNEFAQFGKVEDVFFDEKLGQALVYFDQILSAQRATLELRGRLLGGSRIECDYASHESRSVFFESCRRAQANLAPKTPTTDTVTSDSKLKSSEKCVSNGVSVTAEVGAKDPRSHRMRAASCTKSNPHHENISECSSDEDKSNNTVGSSLDDAAGKLLVSSLTVLSQGRQRKNRLSISKTRRLSAERSGNNNLLDLASSPREIPLVPKHVNKTVNASLETNMAGMDESSDMATDNDRHVMRQMSRSEPMSLPLPKFAQELFSSSSCSIAPKVRRPSKERDPRLHVNVSVTIPSTTASVSAQLKSPPAAALGVSGVSNVVDTPKQPYTNVFGTVKDPRLRSPVPESTSQEKDNDSTSALSENHQLSLDERLKALDEKFERWSSGTLSTGVCHNSSSQNSTQSSNVTSGSMTPSFFKYTSPQTHQPSLIVQKLLSRRSVFDEDSKRLECLSQSEETKRASSATKALSLEASTSVKTNTERAPTSAPALVGSNDHVAHTPALPFTCMSNKLSLSASADYAPTPTFATTTRSPIHLPTTTTTSVTLASTPVTTVTTVTRSEPTVTVTSSAASSTETKMDVDVPKTTTATEKKVLEVSLVPSITSKLDTTTKSTSSSSPLESATVVCSSESKNTLGSSVPVSSALSGSTACSSAVSSVCNNKTIGQVKPLMHTGETLGTKLTSSHPTHLTATATPIKPLVARPTPATAFKPSATVQPTIKQSGNSMATGSHYHHYSSQQQQQQPQQQQLQQRKLATPAAATPKTPTAMEKQADGNRNAMVTTARNKMNSEQMQVSTSNESDVDMKTDAANVCSESKREEESKTKEAGKKKPLMTVNSGFKKEKSLKKVCKDNELKDFLIGKDTIAHAARKDGVKTDLKPTTALKKDSTEAAGEGTKHHHRHHHEHHHHHHKRDRDSSSGHHHRHGKKRKSSKSELEHKSSSKVAKLVSKSSKHEAGNNPEGQPEAKKVKTVTSTSAATLPNSSSDSKMGRIPKIRKEAISSEKKSSSKKEAKQAQQQQQPQQHNKISVKQELKGDSRHKNSKKSQKSSKGERSGKEGSEKRRKMRLSLGSDADDNDLKEKTQKAKKTVNRRKSNASASGNSGRRSNKFSNSESSDGDSDSSETGERSKGKFSIFDEPANLFDADNPVYFSMYDKVKARRSCVKSREEQDRKKQEELLAKFSKLKEKRAGNTKKSSKTLNSDDDNDHDNDDDEHSESEKRAKASKKKSRHHLISSSSSDDDQHETLKRSQPTSANVRNKPNDVEALKSKTTSKKKTSSHAPGINKSVGKSEHHKKTSDKVDISDASKRDKLVSKSPKSKKTVKKTECKSNLEKTSRSKKSATETAFVSTDDDKDDDDDDEDDDDDDEEEEEDDDEEEDDEDDDGSSEEERTKLGSKKPMTGPRVSAVAKVKEAVSSSEEDNSMDEERAFESAKKKESKSIFKKGAVESSKEQTTSDSDHAQARSMAVGSYSSKTKSLEKQTSKKNDLDKRMSNIFGSSSSSTSSSSDDDAPNPRSDRDAAKHSATASALKALPIKTQNLSETDDDDDEVVPAQTNPIKPLSPPKEESKSTETVKKRRHSSKGRSHPTAVIIKEEIRETAESLFDQLTTSLVPKKEERKIEKAVVIKNEPTEPTTPMVLAKSVVKLEEQVEKQPQSLSRVLQSELEKSIASITPNEEDEVTLPSDMNEETSLENVSKPKGQPKDEHVAQEISTTSTKTTSKCDLPSSSSSSHLSQISQEETAQAVTALLGESFVDEKEPQEFMEDENKSNASNFMDETNDSVKKEAEQETESAVANLIEGSEQSEEVSVAATKEETRAQVSQENVAASSIKKVPIKDPNNDVDNSKPSPARAQEPQETTKTSIVVEPNSARDNKEPTSVTKAEGESLGPGSSTVATSNESPALSSEERPRSKLDSSLHSPSTSDEGASRRGRGASAGSRGSRRGGRGRSASASEASGDGDESTKARSARGGRGTRGTRGRGATRGVTAPISTVTTATTATVTSATTAATTSTTTPTKSGRGSRGGRGGGRGARGGAATSRGGASVVHASVACAQRRQSLNADVANLSISSKPATSIFDWPEEMEDDCAPKSTAVATTMITTTATTTNSQQQHGQQQSVVKTEVRVTTMETKPKVILTTSSPPAITQCMPPTSTTTMMSSSVKSEAPQESPSSSTMMPAKLIEASDETKIKAILEQAKREQLVHELELEKIGALKPLQILPTSCVTLGNDITVTKYVGSVPAPMLPTSVSTPTVLTQRHILRTSPHRHTVQPLSPVVRGGQQVVQLPTQPLSPSEIRSQTTPTSKPSSVVIEASKANSVEIAANTITLPTQPVPRAMAVPTAVFPNQPLPISSRGPTGSVTTVSEPATMAAALHLPQHPLPLTQPAVSMASPKPPSTTPPTDLLRSEPLITPEGETRATASPAHMLPKKYMKARDAFGSAGRRQKLQPPQPSPEEQGEEANAKLAAAAAAEQQLALLRTMEAYDLNLYYQHYLGKGHPEHLALSMTQQALQERYGVKDLNVVLGQPSSAAAAAAAAAALRFQQTPPGSSTPAAAFLPADLSAFATSAASLGAPPAAVKYAMSPFKTAGVPATSAADSPASPPPPPTSVAAAAANANAGLESYPVVWQGFLGLKTELATVQIHYVSGCRDVAKQSLPPLLESDAGTPKQMPTLMIQQRLRLEEDKLEDVRAKMERSSEHCVLLALPCGRDTRDVEDQSTRMRKHFITYLQLKSAAGIVNLRDNAFVLHVFPSCDFANKTMSDIAPDLLARVAEIEHMVIVITTTT